MFGLTAIVLLLVHFAYITVGDEWGHGPDGLLEDPLDGFTQVKPQISNKYRVNFDIYGPQSTLETQLLCGWHFSFANVILKSKKNISFKTRA